MPTAPRPSVTPPGRHGGRGRRLHRRLRHAELPVGATSESFTIPIFADPNGASNRTVNIQLTNPTNGGALGSPSITVLTLSNPVPTTLVVTAGSGQGAFTGQAFATNLQVKVLDQNGDPAGRAAGPSLA